MTAALALETDCAWSVRREQWFAQIHDGFLVVFVSPAGEIVDAINTLIPAARQCMWLVEASDLTSDGWEVWVLYRE